MNAQVLSWYWGAITTDAYQRQVFIAHIRTNEERHTRSITLSTLGIRALRKERNAVLQLFAILNLSTKTVSHVTQAKNTEKLVETSSEVTNSNMETATKELLSINKNNSDIKSTGVRFACA